MACVTSQLLREGKVDELIRLRQADLEWSADPRLKKAENEVALQVHALYLHGSRLVPGCTIFDRWERP